VWCSAVEWSVRVVQCCGVVSACGAVLWCGVVWCECVWCSGVEWSVRVVQCCGVVSACGAVVWSGQYVWCSGVEWSVLWSDVSHANYDRDKCLFDHVPKKINRTGSLHPTAAAQGSAVYNWYH